MKVTKLFFIFCMLTLAVAAKAQMVLEYYFDISNTTIELPLNGGANVQVDWGDGSALESFEATGNIPHTYVSSGTKMVTITGTLTWFGGLSSSVGIERLIKVHSWEGVGLVRLRGAFMNASIIEVPSFLPSTVTDLSCMFLNANAFNGIIDNWNTSAVTDMSYMFKKSVRFNQDISHWNTSSVENMYGMFWGATDFNQPIGSWNTANVVYMGRMFNEASSFNQPLNNWNTSSVSGMEAMFCFASNFNQPIGSWNTANVVNMSSMYGSALAFNQPLASWNTSAVTDMGGMFGGTLAFNQPIDSWNTSAVTFMDGMFSSSKTFNQPLNNWNTSSVTDMRSMFYGASSFNQPIGSWNTAKVINMNRMFGYAPAFNQPIGSWDTKAVTDMSEMFASYNAGFFNQPIGNWNTAAVKNMSGMFNGCQNFNQSLETWNTSSVTDMKEMFKSATSFNQPLGNWDVSAVTNLSGMFYNAFAFNQPIGSWNTAAVTSMANMFDKTFASYTTAFNQPLGNWNISAVTNMSSMLSSLCTDNYDATLIGWSTQAVKTGVIFNGGKSKYSAQSANARAALISKGWAISDGGVGLTGSLKCRNNQTISFDPLSVKILADLSFDLIATASSGLAVTYISSNTAVATISGNKVTFVGLGVSTITAMQTGDVNYSPAANVTQLLTIQPKIVLSYNTIRGSIYTDANADCINQGTEKRLSSIVVKATPGDYYGYTDSNGNYEVRVDTGTVNYTLTQQYNVENTAVMVNQCATSYSVALKGASIDTASFDFANEVRACKLPTVDIQHTSLVRCRRSNAYIQYCNLGNSSIDNASITVEYPAHLIPLSSVPMWTSKAGSILVYDIGMLQETTCGRIQIIDSVDCVSQLLLGLTQCIKATIAPSSTCISQSTLWDFSSTTVVGTCENNQAAFVLTNTGDGNMADSLAYRLFVNDTLIYNGKYKLLSGSKLNVRYPAQAQTVRLEADQHPNHPGYSHPKAIVERCGIPSTGYVAKGLVTTTPQDDLDTEVSIVCYPIRGSFDPNDKQATPTGVGVANQVAPGTELDYTVRFQNTGTATALTVKIVDTLDADLNVASFIQGVSSHPYTLNITGKGQAVLTFTFNNINLPDSTSDKLGSNGLVSFKITIPSDISIGTVIDNKAYIYFDYNDPIITNNTMHTVGVDITEDLSKGSNVQVGNIATGVLYSQYTNAVNVYPNPSEGIITVELAEISSNMELRITSIVGALQKTIKLNNTSRQEVNLEGIQQGMYLYEVWQNGQRMAVGKLQIR